MSTEKDKDFVQQMLKSANEKKEAKPQSVSEGVNPDDIDRIVDNLRERIQKKR